MKKHYLINKLQARFMYIIVREFFKIKNERPEEYVENYENALKLLHLQKKYNACVSKTYRINSRERVEPPKRIIKSSKKRKRRKKRSPKPVFKSLDNVLDLRTGSSAKKKSPHKLHPKPFDLYSSFRDPKDPYPDIQDENKLLRSKKKHKKSRKKLKARDKLHHKSGSKFLKPNIII